MRKIQILITLPLRSADHDEIFTGIATMNWPSWVVPQLLQQIQDGGRRPY